MEAKEWITLAIAAWGAGLATLHAVYDWWRRRRKIKAFPYTYDHQNDIATEKYMSHDALEHLAIKVINYSEYPIDVLSLGVWTKKWWYVYYWNEIALECDLLMKDHENSGWIFKRSTRTFPEHELKYKPVKIQPHNTDIFRVNKNSTRIAELNDARGVYIRLADESVYYSWQPPVISFEDNEGLSC